MTTFTTYATATYASGNIVVVQSAENMLPGLPITFLGNTFGNVQANATYYIGNITFGFPTSNITLTSLPGGSTVSVGDGTGNMITSFSQGGQLIIPTVPPGEPLNQAFDAINVNFDQIFAAGPVGSNIQIDENTIYTLNTNGNLILNPNGIGNIIGNAHVIPDRDRVRNLGAPLLRWNTVYAQNFVGNIAGNIDAGGSNTQVQFNDNDLLNGSPGFTFDKTTNAVGITGTVTAGNVLTLGIVSSVGGVYGDIYTTMIDSGDSSAILVLSEVNMLADLSVAQSLDVGGQISATGNITANYYFGNGSQLTGITADNVNADDLIGNILSGNVLYSNLVTVGDLISLSVVGTTTTGNLNTAGSVSATGNVTGGNLLFGSGIVSGTGNIYAGNIFANISGNIDAAGNLYEVQFNTTGDQMGANANFTYDSANNVLTVNGGNIVGGNILTAGRVSASANVYGSWFVGNVDAETVTASANISGGNILTAGQVSATGAGTFGNVLTGGTVSATSTIQGGNILTPGEVSATGSLTGGNIFTGGTVSAVSTITGGNLATAGSVTATGSVTGGNVITAGFVSATGEISGGNISTTGNVTAANVNATTGFFGNINLTGDITVNSLTSNTFISATGNVLGGNLLTSGLISATGNVSGNYFIGNGAFLTGIDTTLISNGNTNVQTYANGNVAVTVAGVANTVVFTVAGTDITGNANITGNVTGGNIVTAGDVSAAGNITGANVNTTTVYSNSDLFLNPAGNVVLDGGKYINNVNNPQQAQDAATKQYVDDAVSAGIHIHQPVYLEAPVALPSATYAQGGNTYTVNQTIAGNTVVFSTAANLQPNDQLWFSNSFEGIVGNTAYFVVSTPNTSAAVLSTAYNGVPVSNITSNTGLTETVRVNSGVGATLTGTANGALTVDSVAVSATNRILVYNQANAVENGVYVVSQTGNATTPFILTRSSDTDRYVPDDNTGLDQGSYFYVQAGATGAGESYVMTNPSGAFIIGYNNIEFTQFSASQVYTANTAAGLSLTGTIFSAKVDNNTTAFDGGGNIIVKAGANLTTPNIGAATGSSLSVTGNVTGGNIDTAGYVTATGNVTGGNIVTAGNITATGNVTGNYFIGNGSQLTGVTAASVDAGNLTGNTLSSNVLFSSLTTVGTLTSLSVAGNIDGGNIATAGAVTATGSVTGGNLVTSGAVTATGSVTGGNVFTGGTVSATGDVTGGNLVTGGYVTATGTVYSGNVLTPGEVSAGGSLTGGNIFTGGQISAVSTITGGNIATTGYVTATGNITGGNIVSAGQISATGNITAPTFLGNLEGTIASLSGNVIGGNLFTSGIVSAASNITGGNIATGGTVSATGNITGGNIDTAGLISAAGTITATDTVTGGNLATGGTISATGNAIAGNVLTSGTVSATGTVQGGNVLTSGEVSATGSLTGGNVFTGGAVSAVGDITGGNLVTAGSVTATGNVTGGNVLFGSGIVSGTGNIYANNIFANISGNIDAAGNINEVQFNGTGDILTASAGFTFDPAANVLTANGNINGANLFTGGSVSATGSITGGNIYTAGVVSATGDITGGNIVTIGQVSGGTLDITGNAVINGDLAVNGNITYVNVTSFNVEDPIIGLGRGANDSPLTVNDGKDRGEQLWYFNTGANVEQSAFIGYDNSANKIIAAIDVTIANEIVTVNDYGTFEVGNLQAALLSAAGNVTAGNLLTVGLVSATSDVTGGNLITGGSVTATGTITGGNILTGGIVSAAGNITAPTFAGNLEATTASVLANVTAGNVLTGGVISATGNITAGNVLFGSGIVSGTGNIYADTIFANISGNVDAAGNLYEIQFNTTGDLLGANANFTYDFANNVFTVANGNIVGGNVLVNTDVSASGNITGNNVIVGNILIPSSGNVTVGNVNINDLAEPVANSDAATKFYVDSVAANVLPIISNQTISPDGISNTFVLNQTATDVGILLTINGITQTPATNYTVTGNSLTMAETPLSSDIIQVRYLTGTQVGGGGTNYANANVVAYGQSGWAGNIVPAGNLVYNLGNSTNRWNDLYLSGNTIYLDSATIGANGTDITFSGNITAGNLSTTGNVFGNVNGYSIGYKDIPQIIFGSNAVASLTDAGKHYYSTTAGNLALTLPDNNSVAFPTGATLTIVVNAAGNVLVNQGTGVSLYQAGSSATGNRVVGAYGLATVMKVAANTWVISGTGVY